MKPETAKIVETELRQFGEKLNLSDTQKEQLKTALQNASDKLDEIREKYPDATRADAVAKIREQRDSIRQRVEAFFTPDQLKIWDEEVAKAKTFLGAKVEG